MTEPLLDAETILVVDDDPGVRELVASVLRRQEFHVLEASNGTEALDVAAEYAAPIDLIVSDINMPQMTGWKLLEQLRAWYPAIRFLMISGYAQPESSMAQLAGTPTAFLPKPFTPGELSDAVRELLDRRTPRKGFSR
jgi:two-component system cell cycle sensor histidine kinase/response regulator CckA